MIYKNLSCTSRQKCKEAEGLKETWENKYPTENGKNVFVFFNLFWKLLILNPFHAYAVFSDFRVFI